MLYFLLGFIIGVIVIFNLITVAAITKGFIDGMKMNPLDPNINKLNYSLFLFYHLAPRVILCLFFGSFYFAWVMYSRKTKS